MPECWSLEIWNYRLVNGIGEVKSSVPCRRFVACKRSLNVIHYTIHTVISQYTSHTCMGFQLCEMHKLISHLTCNLQPLTQSLSPHTLSADVGVLSHLFAVPECF